MRARIAAGIAAACGAAVIAAACGGPPPPAPVEPRCDDVEAGGACMELVFGDDAVLLADEAEVELIHGPQGGYHVVAGVRMIGVDADGKIVVYRATRERDGALLSEMRYGITARRLTADGAFRVRSGDFVILDVTGPDQIAGELLTVEARLETSEGAELATDVRTLSVIDTVDENP